MPSTTLKPWAEGPFELIFHAEMHLKGNRDFDRRMALISFDNSIEQSIATYLSLHPSQRDGLTFKKEDVLKWSRNFHTQIDFLKHFVEEIRSQQMQTSQQILIYYHSRRNELYHGGNGMVPRKNDLQGIRGAAKWIFSTLFDVDIHAILAQHQNPNSIITGEKINRHSAETTFLKSYMRLQEILEANTEKHIQSNQELKEQIADLLKQIPPESNKHYSEIFDEVVSLLDSILSGEPIDPTETGMEELSNQIEEVSGLISSIRDHQKEAVQNALRATIKAIPPTGNGIAGIVHQTQGSGITLSIIHYILTLRKNPDFDKYQIIYLADTKNKKESVFHAFAQQTESHYESVNPRNLQQLQAFVEAPMINIIFTTIQAFSQLNTLGPNPTPFIFIFHDAWNKKLTVSLPNFYPKAVSILFTNKAFSNKESWGSTIYDYSLESAVKDQTVLSFQVEKRIPNIDVPNSELIESYFDELIDEDSSLEIFDKQTEDSLLMNSERIRMIADDIYAHFKKRKTVFPWCKAIIYTGRVNMSSILEEELRSLISKDNENTDMVQAVSSYTNKNELAIYEADFKSETGNIQVAITSGVWVTGFENPLINTIYIAGKINQTTLLQLIARGNRPFKDKDYALIVDYVGIKHLFEGL